MDSVAGSPYSIICSSSATGNRRANNICVTSTRFDMTRATRSHASLQPDLGTPMTLASEPSDSGPTPNDDGQASTPTSSTISTPRATMSKVGKKKSGRGIPKSKRVRTGCLTCRERHLKCDEALGKCQNCRKSNRICRRGIRLNFIDTQTVAPPYYAIRKAGTRLTFRDESRHIASEYVGGFERYPSPEPDLPLEKQVHVEFGLSGTLNPPLQSTRSFVSPLEPSQLETIDAMLNGSPQALFSVFPEQEVSLISSTRQMILNPDSRPLNHQEEIQLVRTFTEEIGPWLDSMDASKYFTHILPFRVLDEPMLLKAVMACGAHLHPMSSLNGEDRASYFYFAATQDLLSHLQNPDRDSTLCAMTATVLGMYEVLSSRVVHGLNHVAGARALIRECHWDARSPGLGGACFWLSMMIELLACLRFNLSLAWDPDTWDIDMNMGETRPHATGGAEMWTHRIVYICAKSVNLRSSGSQFQDVNHGVTEMRFHEWDLYNKWCDQWEKAVPRSMMPLGHLDPLQGIPKSAFPEIWLLNQTAILARLFYLTARLLLCKMHPFESYSPEMRNVQQSHAHEICGIIAHINDRGISSLSTRFLAFAAECLTTREAQEEALQILDRLLNETGWQSDTIKQELQEAWAWTSQLPTSTDPASLMNEHHTMLDSTMSKMPPGVINPTMMTADFSMENHPYRDFYIPPHSQHFTDEFQFGTF